VPFYMALFMLYFIHSMQVITIGVLVVH